MKRYKLEFVGSDSEPLWFDSYFDLERMVQLLEGCPVNTPPGALPVVIRIYTFELVYVEMRRLL